MSAYSLPSCIQTICVRFDPFNPVLVVQRGHASVSASSGKSAGRKEHVCRVSQPIQSLKHILETSVSPVPYLNWTTGPLHEEICCLGYMPEDSWRGFLFSSYSQEDPNGTKHSYSEGQKQEWDQEKEFHVLRWEAVHTDMWSQLVWAGKTNLG